MLFRSAAAVACTGSLLLVNGVLAPVAEAATRLKGIDVSNNNGTIDWSKVPRAHIRFAFLKATEGQTFDDAYYNSNRTAAGANNIVIGAYHFARPDSSYHDAMKEADHFVSFAAPRAGDIVPTLDLEVTGGLTPSALIAWTSSWLTEVTAKLGVKPMIYTSAGFWRSYMDDTDQFAKGGYTLLWIANWFAHHPTLPANRWGGHGWTFWQYTNCGSVPGVNGCVDRDRYRGTNLYSVEIH